MTSPTASAADTAVKASPCPPASPGFARILFRSSSSMAPLPPHVTSNSLTPRSSPARPSTALLRAELHRSLQSDSPASAPVPPVALPLLSSHSARRVAFGGVQRRLMFDATGDSMSLQTAPLSLSYAHDTKAADKLTLPPLSAGAHLFSLPATLSSLSDAIDESFLHTSPIFSASSHLPPRPTPSSSPGLSSLSASSNLLYRLPPSPSMLPVPDFTLHDVNQRRSPMRPQRMRERPECPETPTRFNKRQKDDDSLRSQPVTLFHFHHSSRARRPGGEDDGMSGGKSGSGMRQRVRADSLTEDTDGEGDELSADELTDTSSVNSPTCSPLPPTPRSRLSLESNTLSTDARLDQFELEEEIGSGSFSRVWRARKRTADSLLSAINGDGGEVKHYAIISSKQPITGKRDTERFARHSQHLLLLVSPPTAQASTSLPTSPASSLLLAHPSTDWHPHILRHYALWLENGNVHALTDYYAMGDVRTFFSSEKRPDQYVWQMLYDIAMALQHLAALQILHFDVKPSNILVAPTTPTTTSRCPYRFVLADLGSLVTYSELTTASDLHEGDGHFLAPEVLSSPKAGLTAAVDVFALGRSGLACLTGELLQAACDAVGGVGGSGGSELRGLLVGVSADLCECLIGMVQERVELRWTLDEVIARAKRYV